jgi:hypothetical protein
VKVEYIVADLSKEGEKENIEEVLPSVIEI